MGTSRQRNAIVAVLGGAGAMGRATVGPLGRAGRRVRLLESDTKSAVRVARRSGGRLTRVAAADARDTAALARRLHGASVLVNCAPHLFNLTAMEAALEAGCHYLDLGGLFHTTPRQLRLDGAFRRAGRLAVLGMGSAPGIANVLARAAADRLRRVRATSVLLARMAKQQAVKPLMEIILSEEFYKRDYEEKASFFRALGETGSQEVFRSCKRSRPRRIYSARGSGRRCVSVLPIR